MKFWDFFVGQSIQETVALVLFRGHKSLIQLSYGRLIEILTDISNVLDGKGCRLAKIAHIWADTDSH